MLKKGMNTIKSVHMVECGRRERRVLLFLLLLFLLWGEGGRGGVKACEDDPPHQPGSECSQRCPPLWGRRTSPMIHWQQSPGGGRWGSFCSDHSCGNKVNRIWTFWSTGRTNTRTKKPVCQHSPSNNI